MCVGVSVSVYMFICMYACLRACVCMSLAALRSRKSCMTSVDDVKLAFLLVLSLMLTMTAQPPQEHQHPQIVWVILITDKHTLSQTHVTVT